MNGLSDQTAGLCLVPAQEPAYLTAARAADDTVAAGYASLLADALERSPCDRAVLAFRPAARLIREPIGPEPTAQACLLPRARGADCERL